MKIAIIGTTTSMLDAPYDDPEWEIWGLNGAYSAIKRWDRWFDMHDMEILKKDHPAIYFEFLANAKDKLMLNNEYEECPEARVFPYSGLVEKYGRYFSNTVAWLIAYAIEQKPDEIGIWGVNMATDSEYMHQRPCCEYFLGIAQGKGIKVTIPQQSELLKYNRLYGIDPLNPIMVKLPDKDRELAAQFDDCHIQIKQKEAQLSYVNGYMKGVDEVVDVAIKGASQKNTKILHDFSVQKSRDTKEDAINLNNELNMLYDRKNFLEGAKSYAQYIKVNWS